MTPTSAPSPPLSWTVARIGGSAWLELSLFEVVGGWVPSTPGHEAKAVLSTVSRRHGWRGGLWRDLLPRTADHDPADRTWPATPAAADVVATLARTEGTAERLDALAGVLAALAEGYAGHDSVLGPLADEPVRRVLAVVGADLGSDRAAVAALGGEAPVTGTPTASLLLGDLPG